MTAVSAAAEPDAPAERLLGFTASQIAWCRANEERVWNELRARLHVPPGRDGFERYFSAGFKGDLPPRVGYYAGWRLVERYRRSHPGVTYDELIRLPAETFMSAVD